MPESLTARVDRLEAEVASLKGSLMGIGNEAVSAMGFELWNASGAVVARLETNEQDEPCFTLLDNNGEARCVIGLIDGRPHLSLQDQDGKQRLALAEDTASNLGLLIIGRYRHNRVMLGFASKSGEPFLQIAGTDGAIDLDTAINGWLGLSLTDESKKNRLSVALDPKERNGRPFMVMTDHRGQQRWWRGD